MSEGDVIDVICGYCGTGRSIRIKLGVGQDKGTVIWARPELADIDRSRMYWLRMCPACGTVVSVQYYGE